MAGRWETMALPSGRKPTSQPCVSPPATVSTLSCGVSVLLGVVGSLVPLPGTCPTSRSAGVSVHAVSVGARTRSRRRRNSSGFAWVQNARDARRTDVWWRELRADGANHEATTTDWLRTWRDVHRRTSGSEGLEEDLGYVSASLSQARASQNRLKSELSKLSGSIEQRLNRLTAAFDAFVEISDLRVTLGLFDVHGRVRHQTKQLLVGASIEDVSDADGYWLAPALVALRGVADGAVDPDALSLAQARDPLRTNAFHVLLAATLGGELPSFSEVVPSIAASVPMYQRAIWLLAADGHFGPEGWEPLRVAGECRGRRLAVGHHPVAGGVTHVGAGAEGAGRRR